MSRTGQSNLLVGATSEWTLGDIAATGVRRVSVGEALARASWAVFLAAARARADHCSFDGLAGATPGDELNAFFQRAGQPTSTRF